MFEELTGWLSVRALQRTAAQDERCLETDFFSYVFLTVRSALNVDHGDVLDLSPLFSCLSVQPALTDEHPNLREHTVQEEQENQDTSQKKSHKKEKYEHSILKTIHYTVCNRKCDLI